MSESTIEDRVREQGHGREPAICEMRCANCGDGMRFDQHRCATCGHDNPRYTVDARHLKSVGHLVDVVNRRA